MAHQYVGNITPAPGFYVGDSLEDDELLYSYARFTQKGVTLKAGQGILPLGTVLAQETSSKLWVKYNNAGSGGAEVAKGILRRGVDTGSDENAPRFQNNIVISGIVKRDRVVAAGNWDSAALADLNAREDSAMNTITI